MKRNILIILVLVCAACILGCNRKAPENNKRYTIAVIPKGTIHEFWKTVHAGALKAAEEMNVEIIWKGPLKEDDRESQISVVENIISRQVDGIVLAPLDNKALCPSVDSAKRMNIPVLIFDSGLAGDNYISFVATDNFKGGQIAGEYMAERLGGKGKVAVLRYLEGSDSTTQRENGFLKAISQYKDIEVVSSEQYSGPTIETALMAVENLFSRFLDEKGKLGIDGIFLPLEPSTLSTIRAAQNMNLIDNLVIIGFDSSDKMIASLTDGELEGFVVQNPFEIGYQSVKTMVEFLDGKAVPKRVDTGATLVTKDNVQTSEIEKLLKPSLENQ